MGYCMIRGKDFLIAKIVDEYSVVINGGLDVKVFPGDIFEIYTRGQEITDPYTQESLGTLDFVKAKIVARDVFPRMSVCRNQDQIADFKAMSLTILGKPAELNVAAEDISGGYEDVDQKIHVGDLVRKISSAQPETNQ